jgi:uncharacterized protein with HEPN domain
MHRDLSYLSDISESIKLAINYLEDITFENFEKNTALQDAVIRRIEIIGETSNRISKAVQDKYDYLPWSEMKGMRNLLIHEYDYIDLREVWNTVKNDLPALIKEIDKILNK